LRGAKVHQIPTVSTKARKNEINLQSCQRIP
jgi:hypothetical protein